MAFKGTRQSLFLQLKNIGIKLQRQKNHVYKSGSEGFVSRA
jgi:hypothetical protein